MHAALHPRRRAINIIAAFAAITTHAAAAIAQSAEPSADAPTVVLKAGERPAVSFAAPVHDFGRRRGGDDITHTYRFTNTGTGSLEILRVAPGCGCTTAGDYTRVVAPGETGEIPIRLKAPDHGGPVSKQIVVTTNIPGRDATITLEIRGVIWLPVQVTPRSAAFGRLMPDADGPAPSRKLTLVNNMPTPMRIGRVTSSSPTFNATIEPLIEGEKYALHVTVATPLAPGNHAATLTVETGLPDPATIQIQAYAYLSPPVEITPTQLILQSPRNGPLTQAFYVRSNTPRAIMVSDLSASTDAMKLELTDVTGDGRTFRITVTVPADYLPPAQGDEIRFKTIDPALPVGRIPVTVVSIHDEDDLPEMPEITQPDADADVGADADAPPKRAAGFSPRGA